MSFEHYPGTEAETRFLQDFQQLVTNLDFMSLATSVAEDKPIIDGQNFSFTPLESKQKAYRQQDEPAGFEVAINRRVEFDSYPYIDSGQAIGLVYHERLTALGAALLKGDSLVVIQLQGVNSSTSTSQRGSYYKEGLNITSGLHNGFPWRNLLVYCWEDIASQLGLPAISVQSNANNPWHKINHAGLGLEGFPAKKIYDLTAQSMGYSFNAHTGNWDKELT